MRNLIAALLLIAPLQAAFAQIIGPAAAIDGDTLDMAGERIRLIGIDAPEVQQTCQRNGMAWPCGIEAKSLLARLVANQSIQCDPKDRDVYGRIVARCYAGDRELGAIMVREGLAIAISISDVDYASVEAIAKRYRMGLWGAAFQTPAEYRAANPVQFTRPSLPRNVATLAKQRTQTSVWFRNCSDARAAGAAPLYRGRSGYRPEMDGDGDGIACEPFHGRR